MLLSQDKIALAEYRLLLAREQLCSAKLLLENGQLKDSIGRSYYAIFTSVRALLALDGVDFARHAGVISYFQKTYIKTGTFDVKFSKYLTEAFRIRNNTDYADFYIVAREDAEEQYKRAEEFHSMISQYLQDPSLRIC